jgi:hypothetical protein
MEEWPAVTPPIHFGAKPMLARAQRKELFSSYAGEKDCVLLGLAQG